MTNPFKTPQALSVTLLLARVPIGVYFLIAGYVKIARIGLTPFVHESMHYTTRYMSPQMADSSLHLLPWLQMAVGVALIVGFYTRVAAALASITLMAFLVAVTGVGFNATGNAQAPLNPHVIFLGLTLLLITVGGGEIAVDHSFKSAPGPAKN